MPKNEELTPEDEIGRLSALARDVFHVVLGADTAESLDLNPLDERIQTSVAAKIDPPLRDAMLSNPATTDYASAFNRASNLEMLLARLDQTEQRGIAAMVPSDDRDDISYLASAHNLPLMADVFAPVKK